ncbi:hypothetical protein ASG70_09945 [Phycicoccus sp. Soil748]|nr:hypothetical protein ASG70_09945 [Phycicoccus sp. Soil748]
MLACGFVSLAGVLILVVWILPTALTKHPVIPDAADRHKAAADARSALVALLVAAGAGGTLAYTARSYRLNREGHITERYTKAVEQLGHDTLAVRLGAMYALERIAVDSHRDHQTVVEVLSAFIRKTAPEQANGRPVVAPDSEAAMTILGRLPRRHDVNRANLPGAHLEMADLRGAFLNGANLAGASMIGAKLIGAHLNGADLSGASLEEADLTAASVKWANFSGANMADADLTRTSVEGTDLSPARSLIQTQIDAAIGDFATRLPLGISNPWTGGR